MPTTDDRHANVFYDLGYNFATAMKVARTQRGWTQVQLAETAGVNAETIVRIENGLNTRVSTMEKIRKALPEIGGTNGQPYAHQAEKEREAAEAEQQKADVEALRDQVIYLVRAVVEHKHLQRIRHCVLQQLSHAETHPHKPRPRRSR